MRHPIHLIVSTKGMKTFKRVRYNDPDLKPISDGLAIYKGKMYGTREDLKYMPKFVRLVK
jgi:hypothetical protein